MPEHRNAIAAFKVIGVDPGLAATGIGIVQGSGLQVTGHAFGSIATKKEVPLDRRLECIYSGLMQVLTAERPQLMVVEDIFSLERYPKSAIILGKVTGVILLAGCHHALPVLEIPVREAKRVLTGNGNASKAQLEKAVRQALGLAGPIRPFHASDALGLAMIGLFRQSHARRRVRET